MGLFVIDVTAFGCPRRGSPAGVVFCFRQLELIHEGGTIGLSVSDLPGPSDHRCLRPSGCDPAGIPNCDRRSGCSACGFAHGVDAPRRAICAFQAAYWYRLARVEIPRWRNVVLGHIVGFVGRLSFVFGAALFSLFFLRHTPGLTEGALILVPRIAILLATLFCLYCFTLELERLGNALQSAVSMGPPPPTAGDRGNSRPLQAEVPSPGLDGEELRSK
ncbi:hypothetical protein [Chelatococcus sp. GW1]|uniref:hypothetical protein n=1 Tax=Chelatococcus sp. GW1 TaxID=1211115 RepID=UPI0012F7ADDE|nr:hypothetical protein [Chelatococcus sp. GW1]